MTLTLLRNNLLLANLALLIILNYGYQMVRFPMSGTGLPMSEILLLFALLTMRRLYVIGQLRSVMPLAPYVVWVGYGAINMVISYFEYGMSALRSASPVYESLFLIVGFAFAMKKQSLDRFVKWLPRILIIVAVYSLCYPLKDALLAYSPMLPGFQGQPVPLLFSFMSTSMYLIVLAAYFMQGYLYGNKKRYLIYSIGLMSWALVIFPSRSLILMAIVFILYFGYRSGMGRLHKIFLWGAVLFAGIVIVFSFGLEGKYGAEFKLADYYAVFMEIFTGHDKTNAFTSGTSQRLEDWGNIFDEWTKSWHSILFGMGYGAALVNFFSRSGTVVIEPHNTLVSVFARGGLVGGVAFVWLQMVIVYNGYKIIRFLRSDSRYAAVSVSLLFIIICTLIYGIGEPPLVMPLYAVPYYFCAGIIMRISFLQKNQKGFYTRNKIRDEQRPNRDDQSDTASFPFQSANHRGATTHISATGETVKITFAHNRYQLYGGEERNYEAELALLEKAGHTVSTFEKSNKEIQNGSLYDKAKILWESAWSKSVYGEARKQFAKQSPDVVYLHNFWPLLTPSILKAARDEGAATVVKWGNFRLLCLNGSFLRNGKMCMDCLDGHLSRGIWRKCYRDSMLESASLYRMVSHNRRRGTWQTDVDAHIVRTEKAKELFIDGGLPEERIYKLPALTPDSAPPPEGGSGGLFIGRLSGEKGVETLLRALELNKTVNFKIIGEGPDRERLERLSTDLGLNAVRFLGFLTKEKCQEQMASAGFVVMPSICFENFPMAIVEGFCMSKPLIASRVGGAPEMMTHGQEGLLFEPGNHVELAMMIKKMTEENQLRLAMGRRARKRYEQNYSSTSHADRLCYIMNKAIRHFHH